MARKTAPPIMSRTKTVRKQAQQDLARLSQVIGTWQNKAQLLRLSGEDRAELKDCFLT